MVYFKSENDHFPPGGTPPAPLLEIPLVYPPALDRTKSPPCAMPALGKTGISTFALPRAYHYTAGNTLNDTIILLPSPPILGEARPGKQRYCI